jgi:hypothetical protein
MGNIAIFDKILGKIYYIYDINDAKKISESIFDLINKIRSKENNVNLDYFWF